MDSSTRTEKKHKKKRKSAQSESAGLRKRFANEKNRKRAGHSVPSGSAASVSHCAAIQES
jgi:hypothetical protein